VLGGADGQYNSWPNIQTQQFHEILKYATVSRVGIYNHLRPGDEREVAGQR